MIRKRTKPAGQQRTYGILTGRIADGTIDPGNSPHYEIWVKADRDYRIAVNVISEDGSEVLAYFDPAFASPTKLNLPQRAAGSMGFTPLQTGPGGQGLDYLRDGLFDLSKMAVIPDEGSGVTLQNLLDAQIQRAKADNAAVVLACGEFFSDPGQTDKPFGFSPELGVHDIHMMQGNPATSSDGRSFADDNTVNGDGALFIRFTGGETVALFVRFQTQSTETGNRTGQPI
jgi:uncharacterized protein YukJ